MNTFTKCLRFLKRLLISVLVYAAIYLPFIAMLQALTGYDYTPAYQIGGVIVIVELIVAAFIEIAKKLFEHKNGKDDKKYA